MAKFGIIGIVNTLLDLAIWNALLFIGPIKAQIISTVVAATSSYFMNRHWTFRHRPARVCAASTSCSSFSTAIGLLITSAILGIASYGFDVEDRFWLNVVRFFGIGVATVFRFWAYQKWVFLHPEDTLYETDDPALAPAAHGSLSP